MEVRAGYKQTEVGVIPDDWVVTTIGDQSQVVGRIGFRGYTVNDIVDEGKGAIAINPSNIQNGKIVFDNCTYISWFKYEESPEIKIELDDILLVKTGSTVGKTAIVTSLPEKATLNPQVAVLKKHKVSSAYLGYMLGFPIVQNQITQGVVGGAIPTLSQNLVATFRFPLPSSRTEQEAIATALSDVDTLLAAQDKLIAKKRDIKQAAMQQLLTGKQRLPGFSGEWEVKRLGDVAAIAKGMQLHSSESIETGRFAYLNGGITPSGYTETANTPGETIAISEGGNSCGYVQFMTQPYWCGGHCYSVVPRGVENGFLYHALKGAQTAIMALRVGSGLPNVQKTALQNFSLLLPVQRGEQIAIATILSDMDAELAALEKQRDKTRALKQGMMQELLTGRIRLV